MDRQSHSPCCGLNSIRKQERKLNNIFKKKAQMLLSYPMFLWSCPQVSFCPPCSPVTPLPLSSLGWGSTARNTNLKGA